MHKFANSNLQSYCGKNIITLINGLILKGATICPLKTPGVFLPVKLNKVIRPPLKQLNPGNLFLYCEIFQFHLIFFNLGV